MRIKSSILFLICLTLTTCFSACEKPLELDASVTNLGGQLVIINNDSFTWYDVELYINYDEDDLSSGYSYHLDYISPDPFWVFVPTPKFRNSEGKQFWIYDEVYSLLVRARTSANVTGTYTIEWSTEP